MKKNDTTYDRDKEISEVMNINFKKVFTQVMEYQADEREDGVNEDMGG